MPTSEDIVTRVRALHTFKLTEPGELAFEKGDIIKVVDRGYKDWWRGQLKGRTGIFPVNYVEAIQEPTAAELAKEAEQAAALFSQAVNVEKLLNMLRALDPVKDNLADNEEIQELYCSSMALRPKIIKLIDKYSQMRADLVSMDETFVRARDIFDHMMDESLAKHTGVYDQPTYRPPQYAQPQGGIRPDSRSGPPTGRGAGPQEEEIQDDGEVDGLVVPVADSDVGDMCLRDIQQQVQLVQQAQQHTQPSQQVQPLQQAQPIEEAQPIKQQVQPVQQAQPIQQHAQPTQQPQQGYQSLDQPVQQRQQQQTAAAPADSGLPYIFDPNTAFSDPNVQSRVQYYAMGGMDLSVLGSKRGATGFSDENMHGASEASYARQWLRDQWHSRRHTPGSTTEDNSSWQAPTKKRPVPANSDTVVKAALILNHLGNQLGHIAGRMVTMFTPFTEILTTGIRYKGTNYEPHNHTAQQNTKYNCFLELEKLCPELYDTLQKMGVSGTQDLAKYLDLGRSSACIEDINSIKYAISQWHIFTPEYKPAQKHLLGFHHEECGRLLCPAEMDWSDLKTKEGLRLGVIRALPGDFPAFLYNNEVLNKADLFDGFLKNKLLVKGVIHILIGPSAALTATHSTCGGIAALHGIKSVTAELIAYVASIERFVLDSQVTFSGGTNGQWPYRKFYNAILAVLNDAPANILEDIIEWFNDQVFNDGLYETDGEDDEFIAGSSLAAQMQAQAAKDRKRQYSYFGPHYLT